MTATSPAALDQNGLWNGPAGDAWVDLQGPLDAMFEPFEQLLSEAIPPGAQARVLDVGCGTGAATRAIARRLGPGGRAVGVDLSAPMIALARSRAAKEGNAASFICADAQRYAFEPPAFNMIVSRFGVMFFDDPVQAFAGLWRAAASGGQLRLVVWRSAAENAFMTTAERAAAPLLSLPARAPSGPGQFAFADPDWVRQILAEAGWNEADLTPIDVDCVLQESDLLRCMTRLGPLGLALGGADEPTRARVVAEVRAAFEPYVHGAEVRYTAACWMVRARAE
jgi:SAM-dependent methyltransferase